MTTSTARCSMARYRRSTFALLGILACAAPAATASLAPSTALVAASATQEAIRYVQVGPDRAEVRNLPDRSGLLLADLPAGTPLAVHQERAGFLQVSAPGGYRVWVYGDLLRESGRPGWLELTGNQVNMRPAPRTQNAFPIGQLNRGDRVRFLDRADDSKPMSEDWVQVWSPSTARGWVEKSETAAIPEDADGEQLFSIAASTASAERSGVRAGSNDASGAQKTDGDSAESTQGGAASTDVYAALAAAQELMRQAIAEEATDYTRVRAAYAEVLAMGPDPNTRRIVERDLERVELQETIAATQLELERQKKALAAERERQEALRREAELRNDPLWGRFESRGWLTREKGEGGEPRYVITYAGDRRHVVECSTGRYDLSLFVGFEVGVEGLVSGRRSAAEGDEGTLPTVDARTLEVISGRYRR